MGHFLLGMDGRPSVFRGLLASREQNIPEMTVMRTLESHPNEGPDLGQKCKMTNLGSLLCHGDDTLLHARLRMRVKPGNRGPL